MHSCVTERPFCSCSLFPIILCYVTFQNYLILYSSCFTQTIAYYKTVSPGSVTLVASRRQINHTGSNNVSFIILWSDSFILLFLHFYFCLALIPFFLFWRIDSLFYSVFTICLLILDGAFRLRVWITRQYFPLICYSFNCQQILFISSLPPENICFCLLYSQRDWTRLDPFFRVFLPMLRVQNQKV